MNAICYQNDGNWKEYNDDLELLGKKRNLWAQKCLGGKNDLQK